MAFFNLRKTLHIKLSVSGPEIIVLEEWHSFKPAVQQFKQAFLRLSRLDQAYFGFVQLGDIVRFAMSLFILQTEFCFYQFELPALKTGSRAKHIAKIQKVH